MKQGCKKLTDFRVMPMIKPYMDLIALINKNSMQMVEQLHQFCSINSGTGNLSGLARMASLLEESYKPIADDIEYKSLPEQSVIDMSGIKTTQAYGNSLFIRKRPQLKRRILLSGHMDTVYSETNPFQNLTTIDQNTINGPGVADMKGGLIVMLHALSVFEKTDFAKDMGWDVLINTDEEAGSPSSRYLYDEISSNYGAGLVYEPAMTPSGTLAKNRKGSGKLTLIATGKSAHAGRSFDEGRNAICYLAEVVTAIHALNGKKNGITINIGKFAGGEALNVVPDKAVTMLDIRITQIDDEHWVRNELDKIMKRFSRSGYSLTIHGIFGRPVKRVTKATERLFSRIQQIGEQIGLTIDWKDSGGCCDGNNLAQHGLPVIDTLGVRGGNIHSSEEYILLDSLPERTALSTLLLIDLARGGLEDLSK